VAEVRSTDPAELFARRVRDHIDVVEQLLDSQCLSDSAKVALEISQRLAGGGRIFFFGNGGSSMDAGHLAAEFLGRFAFDRPTIPGVCLADSTAALTAIANDYGYDKVFSRQLEGLAQSGDVVVGLTTSGNSPNVVEAMKTARRLNVFSVALTGRSGGDVAEVADVCIQVPSNETPRIQEACMVLGHTICEFVEQELFAAHR
jgi:D-sedoheptulose 7-phosphate isomerase